MESENLMTKTPSNFNCSFNSTTNDLKLPCSQFSPCLYEDLLPDVFYILKLKTGGAYVRKTDAERTKILWLFMDVTFVLLEVGI